MVEATLQNKPEMSSNEKKYDKTLKSAKTFTTE